MSMEKAAAKISGIDHSYNPDESYEKDGHIYCKKCNERLRRHLRTFDAFLSFLEKCYERRCDCRYADRRNHGFCLETAS